MATLDDLGRSLDALEAIQRDLGQIARRTDAARSQDLIDGRRRLAQQLSVVAEQGAAAFGALDPELARAFRQRFGAMRSGASHLQASWPAVKARDDTSGDYARAVAAVRQADTECVAWVRATVARLAGGAA